MPLSGHPDFWCCELDEPMARALIARTLDSSDLRLREMTRDLARFSNDGRLAEWRPGRDLVCLKDGAESLLGVIWIAEKPLPEREDYLDLAPLRELDAHTHLTCAIRTYDRVRGRGVLTLSFSRYGLGELLTKYPDPPCIWVEMKVHNLWARALARQMGFTEVSGEAGGSVIGVRFRSGS